MGSNPASNHPIAFKWITKAVEKGAKIICVDPRFTQIGGQIAPLHSASSGTDIAFLGGMIKYIIDNNLYTGRVCQELYQCGIFGQSGLQASGRQRRCTPA